MRLIRAAEEQKGAVRRFYREVFYEDTGSLLVRLYDYDLV